MTTTYDMSLAGKILKTYYTGPIREQLNNETLLMKRIKRNTSDIQGGAAVIALHTSRNLGVGARLPGVALPASGQQGHVQSTVPLKYLYGRGTLNGPDINKTKGQKGAFARIMDVEVQGMTRDLSQDINRQLFGDGTGWLLTLKTTDHATPTTVKGWLYDAPFNYLADNTPMAATIANGVTDFNSVGPAWSDTQSSASWIECVLASCTTSPYDSLSFAWDGSGTDSAWTFGSGLGKWGAVCYGITGGATQTKMMEMMGLSGIIHDTNLPTDANYLYHIGAGAYPEITGGTFTGAGSDNLCTLQSVSAATNTAWRSVVKGNNHVRRALTLELMHEMWGELAVGQGARPSIILTSWQVFNKYASLLTPERRFNDVMKLDGGFTGLSYNGVPVVADKDCPNATMFFVDESQLSLYVGEDFNWIEDGSGNPLHYISGYDAFDMVLRYYAELGCHQRNVHGKIIDILES